MTRSEAISLLHEKIKNDRLIKHSYAVEACMRNLAKYFGENEDIWGLAGLLHDIDYEETKDNFSMHGLVSSEILEKLCLDKSIIAAIKAHAKKKEPETRMEWSLYAVDPLTGLIVASCLMHPDKKLSSLDVEFVLRRFKERQFAAGANREQIMACKNIGIELKEFIQICLSAMKEISQSLGL